LGGCIAIERHIDADIANVFEKIGVKGLFANHLDKKASAEQILEGKHTVQLIQ
jgi:AICAR transformylase/IMP cyclohydrolase PurH